MRQNDKELDRKYYCLTVTDKVAFRNGYTYIKELLLQIHKMQEDYNKSTNNAFVTRREHLSQAKKAVICNNNIRGWRHEKGKRIALPTEKRKMKANTLTTIYQNISTKRWKLKMRGAQIVSRSKETEKSPLIIRGKYAGGGKSHIAKHFSKLGLKHCSLFPKTVYHKI